MTRAEAYEVTQSGTVTLVDEDSENFSLYVHGSGVTLSEKETLDLAFWILRRGFAFREQPDIIEIAGLNMLVAEVGCIMVDTSVTGANVNMTTLGENGFALLSPEQARVLGHWLISTAEDAARNRAEQADQMAVYIEPEIPEN